MVQPCASMRRSIWLKTAVVVTGALASAALAVAADFALKDGRVLRQATILKQDPTTVTVRHAEGITQVAKAQLPDAMAADYPVDAEAATTAAAEQAARAAAIAAAQAGKAAAIRRLPAATPAVAEERASEDRPVLREDIPQMKNDRERRRWRRRELSLPDDEKYAQREWLKIYEYHGSGHCNTPLELKTGLWRVRVDYITPEHARCAYVLSAIVKDRQGNKLACAVTRGTGTDVAYGNASGNAVLDVTATGGTFVVIVEEARATE